MTASGLVLELASVKCSIVGFGGACFSCIWWGESCQAFKNAWRCPKRVLFCRELNALHDMGHFWSVRLILEFSQIFLRTIFKFPPPDLRFFTVMSEYISLCLGLLLIREQLATGMLTKNKKTSGCITLEKKFFRDQM